MNRVNSTSHLLPTERGGDEGGDRSCVSEVPGSVPFTERTTAYRSDIGRIFNFVQESRG